MYHVQYIVFTAHCKIQSPHRYCWSSCCTISRSSKLLWSLVGRWKDRLWPKQPGFMDPEVWHSLKVLKQPSLCVGIHLCWGRPSKKIYKTVHSSNMAGEFDFLKNYSLLNQTVNFISLVCYCCHTMKSTLKWHVKTRVGESLILHAWKKNYAIVLEALDVNKLELLSVDFDWFTAILVPKNKKINKKNI